MSLQIEVRKKRERGEKKKRDFLEAVEMLFTEER